MANGKCIVYRKGQKVNGILYSFSDCVLGVYRVYYPLSHNIFEHAKGVFSVWVNQRNELVLAARECAVAI
jgi:hypothetical protein